MLASAEAELMLQDQMRLLDPRLQIRLSGGSQRKCWQIFGAHPDTFNSYGEGWSVQLMFEENCIANDLNWQVSDGVATISIHRPQVRNALDRILIRDLNFALDKIQRRESGARALVLTGSESVFCSGVDLHSVDLSTPDAQQRAHLEMRRFMNPLILRLSDFRMPVLAAVNGAAVGAGMSLALVADIIVAADSAVFSPSFITLGLVPDAGIVYHLSRRIGGGRSLASLLLAERIDSAKALEWGLVYTVVPSNEVLKEAQEIAYKLASGPTCATAKLRSLHSSAFNYSLRQHLQAEQYAQRDSLESGDCVEGVRAFFENRLPSFKP